MSNIITRPLQFGFNPRSVLARGLKFAMLGNLPGSVTARDSSLYGNHGTLTNMDPATDWVKVRELGRKGIHYPASGSPGIVTNIPFNSNAFSICWWAIRQTSGQQYWFDSSGTRDIICGYAGNTFEMYTWNRAGSSIAVPDTTNVYHYAYTFDSTTFCKYRNGVLLGSNAPGSSPTTTSITRIGRIAPKPVLGCSIADPCIWSRALSPHEIAALADRSNTLLEVGNSPLIWTPRLRSYFYAKASGGAPPAGTPWLYRPINSQTIGVCA